MRWLTAVLIVSLLPASLDAQRRGSRRTATPEPPLTTEPGLPPIGLPLPPIGLPLPSMTTQPALPNLSTLPAQPPLMLPGITHAPAPKGHDGNRRHRGRRSHPMPAIIYVPVPYTDSIVVSGPLLGVPRVHPSQQPVPEPVGRLLLEIEPADVAQVYVDGIYIGTTFDLGSEIELVAGTRRIEIRAPGYEALAFDVRIEDSRTITYRGALTPIPSLAPATPASPPPPAPTNGTFYLIPGCYLGNVPPEQVKLPPGCDLSRLVTHKP